MSNHAGVKCIALKRLGFDAIIMHLTLHFVKLEPIENFRLNRLLWKGGLT